MKNKAYIITGVVVLIIVITTFIILSLTLWNTSSNYMKYISEKQYSEANGYYSKSIQGKHEKEISLNNRLNNYIEQLLSNYANDVKTYDEAKTELQGLSSLVPPPSELENSFFKLEEILTSKTSFEKGKTLIDEQNYKEAINELNKVIQIDNNYVKAKELLNEANKLYKDTILAEIQELSDKKDYENAIDKVESLIDEIGEDIEASAKLQELKKQRVNQMIAEAEKLASEKKYAEAITKLKDSKNFLDTEITKTDELIEKYTELLPVNIVDVDYVSSSGGIYGWSEKETLTDFYGNSYNKGFILDNGSISEKYGVFRVYNNTDGYTTLRGRLIISKDKTSSSANCPSNFKIYNDDILVYEKKMSQSSKPIDFKINIAGVENIKIVTYSDDNGGVRWTYLGLVNTYFEK